MAARNSKVVVETVAEDADAVVVAPKAPAKGKVVVPVEVIEDEKVLVVTAVSSSGVRSTRNAPREIKKAQPEGGKLYAIEVSRELIPNWRIQNYWLDKAAAEAGAKESVGPNKTGGAVVAAQVVEAQSILVPVVHA
jgi:hypothetical protein